MEDERPAGGVIPIRPGVKPEQDHGREIAEWVSEQVNSYISDHGHPPYSVAFVMLGDPHDADQDSRVNSWSPLNEQSSRLAACATAAALLMHRATQL